MLDVRLLGGLAISVDGRLVHGALGASGRRCAAFLFAFPNQVHRKERLVDLVWDNSGAKRGRHALNTAIWRLRRVLKAAKWDSQSQLISTANEIVLEAQDTTPIDLHRFEELAAQCFATEPSERTSSQLRTATATYRGPFLDGEDDNWVLVERERLHSLFVRSLIELIRLFSTSGCYEEALECGRRVLAADPLRESVQRSVMLLHVLNGERAKAVEQFSRCRDLLRTECDVEPMPQTERLASLITSGQVFERLAVLCEKILGEGVHPGRDPLAL